MKHSWKYMVGLSWARQCRHCGMKQKVRRHPRAADLEKTTIAETLTIWPDRRRVAVHDAGPCLDAPAEERRPLMSPSLWTYELATQAAELLAGIASPPWEVGLTEAEDEVSVMKVLRAAYRSGPAGPIWMRSSASARSSRVRFAERRGRDGRDAAIDLGLGRGNVRPVQLQHAGRGPRPGGAHRASPRPLGGRPAPEGRRGDRRRRHRPPRLATRLGVDLSREVDRKMAVNRGRVWNLDKSGHGYHVRDRAGGAP